MQSVDLEVRCEELITIAEHSAFLVAWSHLVGEDVGVAYSRDKVEKLPRRGLRVPSGVRMRTRMMRSLGISNPFMEAIWTGRVGLRGNGPRQRAK